MAYKVTNDCTNCGVCESECPAQAISEKDNKRVIDEDICTECGICADSCPAGAIVMG
ncbi:MAG: 4Fe-4S binding protein [Candidatus Margulisbacteria bacterium]|nr:4Fe-4S binding protein [Candidatus Margulisiibacteriota bacterium]